MMLNKRLACSLLAAVLAALTWTLLFTTPVYADDCFRDPFNAADCMRTPGYREFVILLAAALNVTTVVIINTLAPFWEGLKLLDKTGKTAESLWNSIVAPFRPALSAAMKKEGADLADRTPELLKSLGITPPDENSTPVSTPVTQPGNTVDRIKSWNDAESYLRQQGVYEDLLNLNGNDPDYWKKMDDIMRRGKFKGIAVDYNKDGTFKATGPEKDGKIPKDIHIVVEEAEELSSIPEEIPPPKVEQPATKTGEPVEQDTKKAEEKKKPVKSTVVQPPKPPEVKKEVAPQSQPEKKKDTPSTEAKPRKWDSSVPVLGPAQSKPSPTGAEKSAYEDATPHQEEALHQAHEIAFSYADRAIEVLEAAKTRPNHIVELYFGIKGTGREDIGRINELIWRYDQVKKAMQDGVTYEVESTGPFALRPGIPIDPTAVGYVKRSPFSGQTYGDVHIVYPRFEPLGATEQGRAVLHEVTHRYLNTKDYAYQWEGRFRLLDKNARMLNADSMACFARDAAQPYLKRILPHP
jgi:hypothetical protein